MDDWLELQEELFSQALELAPTLVGFFATLGRKSDAL
jgi:hypothetical protein